jgi:hypothetical protein
MWVNTGSNSITKGRPEEETREWAAPLYFALHHQNNQHFYFKHLTPFNGIPRNFVPVIYNKNEAMKSYGEESRFISRILKPDTRWSWSALRSDRFIPAKKSVTLIGWGVVQSRSEL